MFNTDDGRRPQMRGAAAWVLRQALWGQHAHQGERQGWPGPGRQHGGGRAWREGGLPHAHHGHRWEGPQAGGPGHRGPGEEWGREFERAFRGFERAFRGFDRGFGPPFFGGPRGPEGPHGFGPGRRGPGGRAFGRGDIKYVLLDLLRERPMHGYEMIKELEARFAGAYVPSAGSIYPTLQLLEDRGFASSQSVDGKNVYTITDAGRAFLDERPEHVEGLRGRGAPDAGWNPAFLQGMQAVGGDFWELGRLVVAAVQGARGEPQRLERIREALRHAREELQRLSHDNGPTDQPGSTPGPHTV